MFKKVLLLFVFISLQLGILIQPTLAENPNCSAGQPITDITINNKELDSNGVAKGQAIITYDPAIIPSNTQLSLVLTKSNVGSETNIGSPIAVTTPDPSATLSVPLSGFGNVLYAKTALYKLEVRVSRANCYYQFVFTPASSTTSPVQASCTISLTTNRFKDGEINGTFQTGPDLKAVVASQSFYRLVLFPDSGGKASAALNSSLNNLKRGSDYYIQDGSNSIQALASWEYGSTTLINLDKNHPINKLGLGLDRYILVGTGGYFQFCNNPPFVPFVIGTTTAPPPAPGASLAPIPPTPIAPVSAAPAATSCTSTSPGCSSGGGIPCDVGRGPAFKTAIGCIHTSPVEFVKDFMRFIIAISGGLAFLMMLLGAYQMLTSAGNPDSLNAGRERLTSAIIGLLFVIFAVLLMQIIGVGFLNLPGFLSK